jgi:hypothetical protein
MPQFFFNIFIQQFTSGHVIKIIFLYLGFVNHAIGYIKTNTFNFNS